METTKNRDKGCGIAALIGMSIGCLFLLGVGIFALTVADAVPIAFLCGGIGLLGLIGCIVLGVVMVRQSKQGITAESKQQWQTGVLTDKVIKKDLYAHSKTVIISWFAMTGLLALLAVWAVGFSEDITITTLAIGISPFITLFLGIKALIDRNKSFAYRIAEDKVIGGEVKIALDVVDAVTTHLPTKTPVLYLEKHGEYQIDSMHIHPYYPAEALVAVIEPGEEVYVVYSVKTDKLLHIYRKKHWTL